MRGGEIAEKRDLALFAAHGGARTAFVCQAMSSSEEDCGLRGLLSLTGKWMFGFRVYAPWVWSLAALATFAKLWLYAWAWRWSSPGTALFLAAADVLTLRVLSGAYALCLEEDALPWSAALCACSSCQFAGFGLLCDDAYATRLQRPAL